MGQVARGEGALQDWQGSVAQFILAAHRQGLDAGQLADARLFLGGSDQDARADV